MKLKTNRQGSRRNFSKSLLVAGFSLGFGPGFFGSTINAQSIEPLKIGIIGSGRIGGAVGLRWAQAGHQILFSSRNPDGLTDLVSQAGANASAGYPADAATFGDIVFIAINREAHRDGELMGIPIAGDDAEAIAVASRLVVDSGFDPVFVGGLDRARDFDRGTKVYVKGMTASEIRASLGI